CIYLSSHTPRSLISAPSLHDALPISDSPVAVLGGDEREILQSFWKLATETNLFVGHNVLDFDLRFIHQRSIIHQIKPSRELPFADRKSTRLNSSHVAISYAVFCLTKK